jgi:uncharacterized lipoprotein NlpE involved in copper resistance
MNAVSVCRAVLAMAALALAQGSAAQRLALPATFAGVLPCADCSGIAHTLTLRADGLYRLRRTYLGKAGAPQSEHGRWSADASGRRLTLGQGESAMQFALVADTLRLLDRQGAPIKSRANHTLGRTAQVDPFPEPLRWRGQFVYLADAATFTDCATGLRWPVAVAGDYLAAERRYTQARSVPGAAVNVVFDGRLDMRPPMEGAPKEHIVIDRFAGTTANACGGAPMLQGTEWQLVELDGQPTPQSNVRVTLAADGRRAAGFSGCNRFAGAYELDGAVLRFAQLAGTRMACVAPAMELEGRVLKMFGTVTSQRIDGERLLLLAADGSITARFEPAPQGNKP